jgi:hypothetical protein
MLKSRQRSVAGKARACRHALASAAMNAFDA